MQLSSWLRGLAEQTFVSVTPTWSVASGEFVHRGSASRHNDVTIYSPTSADLFRRVGRAGGAQRQMALLAGELARRGLRVAFVVYPIPDDQPGIDPRITLVERKEHAGSTGPVQTLLEGARVLRSLVAANGRVVVVRSGTPVVGLIALYCRLWRTRFVFSSANNLDFLDQWNRRTRIYGFGVRSADAVVVQSKEQEALARRRFPDIRKLVCIPSFADEPRTVEGRGPPTAFFWVGRLVEYKRPLLYADLAAAIPDARFVLVPLRPLQDAGEREALEQLELAAARIPNLELRDSLPHAELVEELASAVAMVSTSSFEGMPNTFLEAWGQGVPVLTLAFDPDGVVRDRGLGVCADGSWERFVAGARQLWNGRFEREELAQRTRDYLREVHSVERVGAQWQELLESVGGLAPSAAAAMARSSPAAPRS
jgi:glycosyltransferase involved in cell wall biosynthesis